MFHGKKSFPFSAEYMGAINQQPPEIFLNKPMGSRYLKHLVELRGNIQAAGHVSTEVRP